MRAAKVSVLAADDRVVVVGAGQAGLQLAASLRGLGFEGPVTLIGDEEYAPYQRPPLSKSFLSELVGHEKVALRPADWFERMQIELRLGRRVVSVDPTRRCASLDDGTSASYDHLVIATGVRARALPPPHDGLSGVMTIRNLRDALALRALVASGRAALRPLKIVVVGGGFIGLEFAAKAVELGHHVTVVEALSRTLARVASPEVSSHLEAEHRRHGVRVLVDSHVVDLGQLAGRVTAVHLKSGENLPADLVLVGIGVVVDIDFMDGSGVESRDGIVVNGYLQTSNPTISAIGDVANYPSAHARRSTRIESVQNAVDQARFLASRLMGAATGEYRSAPWFWTNQFKERVQIAGVRAAADVPRVLGDPSTGRFSVLYFDVDDVLTCVESVNSAADHMAARKLFESNQRLHNRDILASDLSLAQQIKSKMAAVSSTPPV